MDAKLRLAYGHIASMTKAIARSAGACIDSGDVHDHQSAWRVAWPGGDEIVASRYGGSDGKKPRRRLLSIAVKLLSAIASEMLCGGHLNSRSGSGTGDSNLELCG